MRTPTAESTPRGSEVTIRIAAPAERFGRGVLLNWCSCPTDVIELVAVATGSGHRQYRACCLRCGHSTTRNIPHNALSQHEREWARVIRQNEPRSQQQARCERCGEMGAVELHHWAPRALFEDCHRWPTAWLCQGCHARWHQIMNRPAP